MRKRRFLEVALGNVDWVADTGFLWVSFGAPERMVPFTPQLSTSLDVTGFVMLLEVGLGCSPGESYNDEQTDYHDGDADDQRFRSQ